MKVWMVTEEVAGERDEHVLYADREKAERHVRGSLALWVYDEDVEGKPYTELDGPPDEAKLIKMAKRLVGAPDDWGFEKNDEFYGWDAFLFADSRTTASLVDVIE